MQKFKVCGYHTGTQFYDGSHADCLRWLNHKYQFNSRKYNSRSVANYDKPLLPEPMLVIPLQTRARLTDDKPVKIVKVPWTPEEECYLRNSLGQDIHMIAKHLPRHTFKAVSSKATAIRQKEAVK